MVILIALALIALLGWTVACRAPKYSDRSMNASIVAVLATVFLVVALITIPVVRAGQREQIIKFNAFKATLEDARTSHRGLTDLERAAITIKIAEWNGWLASSQYDVTNSWFQFYQLDDVMKLEPLK